MKNHANYHKVKHRREQKLAMKRAADDPTHRISAGLSPVNTDGENDSPLLGEMTGSDDEVDVCDQEEEAGNEFIEGQEEDLAIVEAFEGDQLGWITCTEDGTCQTAHRDERSCKFFMHNHLAGTKWGGVDYLVKRSVVAYDISPTDVQKMCLPPHHNLLQMRIANLCFLLSKREQQLLLTVINGCYDLGCEDGFACARSLAIADFNTWYTSQQRAQQNSVQLSDVQRSLSSTLCSKTYSRDLVKETAWEWSSRLPKTLADVRRLYLEGRHSILRNLPHPPVQTDIPGHSYVSLVDCIRDHLSHYTSRIATINPTIVDGIPEFVTHSVESRRAKTIALNGCSVDAAVGRTIPSTKSYILMWSDDVETNTSTKQGRGGVWVLTMTIATHRDDGHLLKNTYPIAIGKKGSDHDTVIARTAADLEVLADGSLPPFYIGARRQKLRIHFELLAFLQDQLERREFNKMRAGSGIFSPRFRVSANHKSLYAVLKACPSCLAVMIERLSKKEYRKQLPVCGSCLNWDVLKQTNLSLTTPPQNYPRVQRGEEGVFYKSSPFCRIVEVEHKQLIGPFEVTYESMKGAVALAHECYLHHGWTKQNCETYLSVECLNEAFISQFQIHAFNCLVWNKSSEDLPGHSILAADRGAHPEKYERISFPPQWSRKGIDLWIHADVIMHLLFLGIVKAVIFLIRDWLKDQNKGISFVKMNAAYLNAFRNAPVDWADIQPHTGENLGGWVSDNYMDFSRFMLWYYQNLEEATVKEVPNKPPETMPQASWLKAHNEYWLKVRGLDSAGKADELRARVQEYMSKPEPPKVKPVPQFPATDILALIEALTTLIKCVMAPTVTSELISKTGYAVRVFLSSIDKVDSSMRKPGEVPSFIDKYNFSTLMNLPLTMERFGPLRQLWEGSARGEGFLRFVKPMMNMGMKFQHWHKHLMEKLLCAKAFDNILSPEREVEPSVNSPVRLSKTNGGFHKYKSRYEFLKIITETQRSQKHPASVILVENDKGDIRVYGVVMDYMSCIRVTISEEEAPTTTFGLSYYKVNTSNGAPLRWDTDIAPGVVRLGYGMLLPNLGKADDESTHRFALVSSNWRELHSETPLSELLQ